MMKETKKSLKNYFIIVGVLGFVSGAISIFTNLEAINVIMGVITCVLAVMFFYYGLKMDYYLKHHPKNLITFVIIAFSIHAISFAMSEQFLHIIGFAFVVLYLSKSIKRLSKDLALNKK